MKRKDQKEDEETLNFEINEDDDDEQELELLEENRLKVFRKHTELTHIEPDYNSDTSDEDTLGNIPIHWYDEFDHLGYDIHGKKIPKPTEGDKLDDFIDNQNYILDKYNNKIYLKKEELELIKKIGSREFLEIDPYEDQIEFFSSNVEVMPLSGAHEPKSRFIPSKQEARKIMKLARRIQKGYGRVDHKKVQSDFKYYDIWAGDNQISRDKIQAPKIALPQHLESYNPPEEYILSKEEEEEWKGLDAEDRPHNFLPKKHSTLREVKQYERFIQERFERCLDLYLCPRTIKQKIDIDPDSLIPKLPSPKDLKPFPTKLSITYKGHSQRVRSISVDPSGRYLCSGGDDKTVRVWEISSGRNLKTFEFENIVMNVSWNPNSEISLVAVSTGNEVVLINPGVFNDEINQDTLDFVSSGVNEVCENKNTQWIKASEVQESRGHYINIRVEDVNLNINLEHH
jgi:ribosome biogenesis protein ERB1